MHAGSIAYDNRSGTLVPDQSWVFELWPTNPVEMVGEAVYAKPAWEGKSRFVEVKDCPYDRDHVTDYRQVAITVDLFGGPTLADFVPLSDDPLPIISEQFAERLQTSALSGYRIMPIVQVTCNQTAIVEPKLLYLEFAGKGGIAHHRWKVTGAPNLCPHCHKVPMVCPGCGYINWPKCSNCRQLTLFRPDVPEYSHPKGFRLEESDLGEYVQIVEGSQWDGSDFFRVDRVTCVSNRAKDWLEETHTFPVGFKPALLNIEGVEDRFPEWK